MKIVVGDFWGCPPEGMGPARSYRPRGHNINTNGFLYWTDLQPHLYWPDFLIVVFNCGLLHLRCFTGRASKIATFKADNCFVGDFGHIASITSKPLTLPDSDHVYYENFIEIRWKTIKLSKRPIEDITGFKIKIFFNVLFSWCKTDDQML